MKERNLVRYEMKILYGLLFNYQNINTIIAYSKKVKRIQKYLNETLHLNQNVKKYFSIIQIENTLQNNLYYRGNFKGSELISFGGFVFTQEEWEILDEEYEEFKLKADSSVRIISTIIDALSYQSKLNWIKIAEEINRMDNSDMDMQLYGSFIRNHELYNNDGDIKAFLNRITSVKAHRENKYYERECNQYRELPYT